MNVKMLILQLRYLLQSLKFKFILNIHAPWGRVQQRKRFSPWLTEETKNLIKLRDQWKKVAKDLAVSNPYSCQALVDAWGQYKKYRNQINNRKKHEEKMYKAEKLAEVSDNPGIVWKSAKAFMGWTSPGTPSQIKVKNDLITSAKEIARHMNEYFIQKVLAIRSGMQAAYFSLSTVRSIMKNKRCKLQLSHINVGKVQKILKSLSSSRSTSIDELDNYSLKLAAENII